MKLPALKNYTPVDLRRLILPIQAGIFMLLGGTVLTEFYVDKQLTTNKVLAVIFGMAGAAYTLLLYKTILPSPRVFNRLRWLNTLIIAFGVIVLQAVFPHISPVYLGLYTLFATTLNAVTAGRAPACVTFILITAYTIFTRLQQGTLTAADWAHIMPMPLASIIVAETILRLQDVMQEHIRRMEIVNEFARRSAFSLNTSHVLDTLNSAIQNAIEADTYFVGIHTGEKIRLELFYDDGEYFTGQEVNTRGTLSSWVIRNNKTLFISDLREEPQFEDVKMVQVGKEKLNLCWLGVPMRAADVAGLLAVASYRPNAFDRNDVELVENLAQHTAQALGNTFQHARLEEQAHLDSLTGVYNHGHFLKVLREQAQTVHIMGKTLSLVMLDIDFFKQYNDTYGHLAGDEILTTLCNVIRRHIKSTDSVGRWGGEEFVISLPGANGLQAHGVCKRIQESIGQASIHTLAGVTVPSPSISQGIATFPDEAHETMTLIDLADKRLYMAKRRGRNQIEPDKNFWDETGSAKRKQSPPK